MTPQSPAIPLRVSSETIDFAPDALVVWGIDASDPANEGHVSRFNDDAWCIHPAAEKPTRHARVGFQYAPEEYLDTLKRAVFIAINVPTPIEAFERPVPGYATRPTPGGMVSIYRVWRRFTEWLVEHRIASLSKADRAVLDCYDEFVRSLAIAPASKEALRRGVTRLWLLAPYLPREDQLPRPPWEADTEDDVSVVSEPREAAVENRTPPIHSETMSALLMACLHLIDWSDDILRARNRRDELSALARHTTRPGDLQRWMQYLKDLRKSGSALPGMVHMSRTKGARKFLSAMLDVNTNLIGKYWPDDVPIRLGAPLDTEIRGRIDGRPWTPAIDYYEVDALIERLATACFIVTTYLTGMRPEECRGLERGCCRRADPNDELSGYEIHGRAFKVRGSDGNFVSGGQERDQPWASIGPAARAIAVMERMHSLPLLFAAPAFTTKRPLTEDFAVSVDKINGYITRLIEWWNQCAVENGWPAIPPEPEGPDGRVPNVTSSRFRRTVAWFVYRRPSGLIALGWQYGHIDLRQSAAYGSRVNSGMNEVLEEFVLAQRDTLEERSQRLESGEGASGSAALPYFGRIQGYRTSFRGQVLSRRDYEELLRNPSVHIYDSERQFATCCFDASQALCLGEGDTDGMPVVTECQAQCPNLLRTDADVQRIAEEIQSIDAQIASPVVAEPLKKRLRQVRSRFVQIMEAHERDRIVPSKETE